MERLNRVFLKSFRAATIEGKLWKEALSPFLLAYRTTPHVTTEKTPAFLLFGREFKTKLPSFEHCDRKDSQIREKVSQAQTKKKKNTRTNRLMPNLIHLIKATRYFSDAWCIRINWNHHLNHDQLQY